MIEMIIKTLVENKTISPQYRCKHGLCFYIETRKHKILFDLGEDDVFLDNAIQMGVDIASVDTVIISHGHNDHAGALWLFLEHNTIAKVYIREHAFDSHYSLKEGCYKNISIDQTLKTHPQIILTEDLVNIDDELMIFSAVEAKEFYSTANLSLYARIGDTMQVDDFRHEQNLIIFEDHKKVLICGCAHAGIVNIKKKAEYLIDGELDYVLGGFHLHKPSTQTSETNELIENVGRRINNGMTQYYTCHCTGDKAYTLLKNILNEKISYVASGSVLEI